MTFTILAFCPRSGKIGLAQSTGTPAVSNRTFRIFPGRGVLTVQAGHNFYQRELAIALYEAGYGAEKILHALAAADPNSDQRQTAVVNVSGDIAVRTGPKAFPWNGSRVGKTFAVAGNALVGPQVVEAMADAFEASADQELEERLLRAIEAGRDAGGQPTGQRSAVLQVYADKAYPLIDLRVDINLEPVGELRKGFDWYLPLAYHYVDCYEAGTVARYRDHLKSIGWPESISS
ncbi:DUF1028 domain-containing protein [Roseixanthobacter pseudopolyaromaticivorans]|uniref:DUF1028 domain-containing protein n=1 Tax=Xanthobacteraceae TaxID=335928 RepID=UPI0037278D82